MAIHVNATIYCRKHPRYVGRRYPRSECETCLVVWKIVHSLIFRRISTDYVLRYFSKFSSRKGK